jgi:CheY-like chemotaxis protein
VLRAKDAQSALAIVESGVPIDVLFTDVAMPGALRSTELARETRERLPAVAVLFTSGYTDNAIVHSSRLDEGIELLSKPYTHEALARKVRHVLADPHRRAASNVLAASRPQERESDTALAAVRRLSILLVEDDVLVRSSTTELLATFGLAVVEANSGPGSDARAARAPGRCDADRCRAWRGVGRGVRHRGAAAHASAGRDFLSVRDLALRSDEERALAGAQQLRKPYDPRDVDALKACVR